MDKLKKGGLWLDAFSQVFFSLSIAKGCILTYASYNDVDMPLIGKAITICVGDLIFNGLASVAVFSSLGVLK